MQPLEQVGELVVHDREEGRVENPKGAHAWFCDTDEQESGMAAFSLLSPDERARAVRLRRDLDRRRFVANRAFTRRVLGGLVRRPPERLVFRSGRCGKPRLSNGIEPDGAGPRSLDFSVSHSEDVLGLAVTFDREVGLDLEVVRPLSDPLAIAATQFGPAGLHRLQFVPERRRDLFFYRLWTCREASAKMQGRGIACRHVHEPPTIARWTTRSFTFRAGERSVVGALALEDLSPPWRRGACKGIAPPPLWGDVPPSGPADPPGHSGGRQ